MKSLPHLPTIALALAMSLFGSRAWAEEFDGVPLGQVIFHEARNQRRMMTFAIEIGGGRHPSIGQWCNRRSAHAPGR